MQIKNDTSLKGLKVCMEYSFLTFYLFQVKRLAFSQLSGYVTVDWHNFFMAVVYMSIELHAPQELITNHSIRPISFRMLNQTWSNLFMFCLQHYEFMGHSKKFRDDQLENSAKGLYSMHWSFVLQFLFIREQRN